MPEGEFRSGVKVLGGIIVTIDSLPLKKSALAWDCSYCRLLGGPRLFPAVVALVWLKISGVGNRDYLNDWGQNLLCSLLALQPSKAMSRTWLVEVSAILFDMIKASVLELSRSWLFTMLDSGGKSLVEEVIDIVVGLEIRSASHHMCALSLPKL